MVSIIADVRYSRVKEYSRKYTYTIGYILNTHSKYRNTHCHYIKVVIFGFFFILNSFLSIVQNLPSASTSLKIHNCSEQYFIRYIRVLYNEGLL
jgi:hypothetical protein